MLGHQQSGHVNTIGFDLYCNLIEETVKELKGEKVEQKIEPELDLQLKGFIPKFYISDLNQRNYNRDKISFAISSEFVP